jgi:hypothetical protein
MRGNVTVADLPSVSGQGEAEGLVLVLNSKLLSKYVVIRD